MRKFMNQWGSTLIFWSFVITSVTGVLLFFRVRTSPNEQLHIWIGFLMIAGAATHIARNWRQFLDYFRKPRFYAGLALTLLISAWFSYPVLFGSEAAGEGRAGGPPGMRSLFAISAALAEEPLSMIATIAHTDSDTIIKKLGNMGIAAADANASLRDIAQASGKDSNEILASLLGGQLPADPGKPAR
jgi:hypothetical protein